jgi:hypothetical protein
MPPKARPLFIIRHLAFFAMAGATLFTAVAYRQQGYKLREMRKEKLEMRQQHEADQKTIHDLDERVRAYEAVIIRDRMANDGEMVKIEETKR